MIEVNRASLNEVKKEYSKLYALAESQNSRINQLKEENISLLSENARLKYELEKLNGKKESK